MTTTIESPCVLVCSIDMKTGYCFGCGRTADEIASWMNYSSEERHDIMQGLETRLQSVEQKPRRQTRRRKMAEERGEITDRVTRFEIPERDLEGGK